MTQTNYDDLMLIEPVHKIHHSDCTAADELDNLDVLSLCEGTTDEYDNITEDDYLSDDRKLDKSIDTTSSCTKSSSAERDDDSDVVILRNQSNTTNRTASACSLPRESVVHRLHAISSSSSYPIHYSDKSLHGLKSECSSSSSGGSATISNSSRSQLPPRQRPFVLHLHNESSYHHNALELPSPSSASLHSGHGHITMQELTTKCNSAPILLKKERKRDTDFVGHPIVSISTKQFSSVFFCFCFCMSFCRFHLSGQSTLNFM